MTTSIGIVGAGPAGLAAALAATQAGLHAVLYEQAPDFRRVGGGILIHSNGQQALDALGLLGSFRPKMRLSERALVESPPGHRLAVTDLRSADVPHPAAAVVLRYDLQEHLLAAVRAAGVELRFGTRCVAVEPTVYGAEILLDDRGRHRHDIVLGCDGIYSRVRECVGLEGRISAVGEAYLRGVAERELAEPVIREIWGRDGRRFGTAPLSGGRTYFFCSVPLGLWPRIRDEGLARWISSWEPFGREVVELLRAVPDWGRVSYDELKEVKLSRWAAPPVFVIGDAAHAMTPNLGQGANSALVDAVVLVRLLAETLRKGRAPDEAARRFQELRKPFVDRTQLAARRAGRLASLRFPPARVGRRAIFAAIGRFPKVERQALRLTAGFNAPEQTYLSPTAATSALI